MKSNSNLPDNAEELKRIIRELQCKNSESQSELKSVKKELSETNKELSETSKELSGVNKKLSKSNKELSKANIKLKKTDKKLSKSEEKYERLLELTRLLRLSIFGKKSEKIKFPELFKQLSLFNDAEDHYISDFEEEENSDKTEVKSHKRKKSGRKPLPEDLERVEVMHDIPEAEKLCSCGHMMDKIGEEVSEKLEFIPARVYVKRHVRPKYACKKCEGVETEGKTVKIAPVPAQLLPKSIVSPSLAAQIITSKFVDSLPFYRQEKQFLRHNIKISRSSMSIWALKLYEKCYPLQDLLFRESRSGPVIQIDETSFQVLDEQGRKPSTKSYMWVMRGGTAENPAICFRYYPTRSGTAAKELLKDYEGYVQSDGYKVYDFLNNKDTVPEEWSKITHIGCWAHARRKFFDVRKGKKYKKPGLADKILGYIAEIYKFEKQAREDDLSPEEITDLRQKKTKPVVNKIKTVLDDNVGLVPSGSTLGKAFQYTLSQWNKLIVFLDDGKILPDNNGAENAIRPFVVGRKNWMFSQSTAGAKTSAFFYSLVETAKANKLEPFAYLKYLFEKLPFITDEEDYKSLLPMYVDKENLK